MCACLEEGWRPWREVAPGPAIAGYFGVAGF